MLQRLHVWSSGALLIYQKPANFFLLDMMGLIHLQPAGECSGLHAGLLSCCTMGLPGSASKGLAKCRESYFG